MQEGVAQLPTYGADDMTFFQEEEVFPALPAVIPTRIDEEEDAANNPATKTDAKPGGKRKLTDEEAAAKKVRYLLCGSCAQLSCHVLQLNSVQHT